MAGLLDAYRNESTAARQRPLSVVLHTRVVTETGGGPDKTILNSPRCLQPRGYRTLCAYMHDPDDPGYDTIRQRAQSANAPLRSVPDGGAWDWRVAKRLLCICREENVSIWHAHDYKSNALGLLLRRFHPMKLVTTVHGWVRHTRRTPLYYWLDRRCLPRYDHVICVSEDLHRECRRVGVPEGRLTLVHNAIDTERYRRLRSQREAKKALGFAGSQLLVGAVGRLSEEKGFDQLVRVTKTLAAEGLPVQAAIVGDGAERDALQRLIAELGAEDCVRLLGFRSDVKQLYEAMDVFALTSLREGLPNVVLEAMAMEVPVLATGVAGIPQLIRDGNNGLLVDIGNPHQLQTGLRRLIQDEGLRKRFAEQGRATVEHTFSFQRRMDRIAGVYNSLV